jgi:hypothetical protein
MLILLINFPIIKMTRIVLPIKKHCFLIGNKL